MPSNATHDLLSIAMSLRSLRLRGSTAMCRRAHARVIAWTPTAVRRLEGNMGDEVGREVVLHYRDGSTHRGELQRAFSPGDHYVDVKTPDGKAIRVEFERLKAVFFIKDPRRRDLEVQISTMDLHARTTAASARVEFFDGEVVHGRVAQYSVEEHGFFLFPTAPESNNEKIFVVIQALKNLYVETLADGET
jgi:Family of unknown function (DUF6982)